MELVDADGPVLNCLPGTELCESPVKTEFSTGHFHRFIWSVTEVSCRSRCSIMALLQVVVAHTIFRNPNKAVSIVW